MKYQTPFHVRSGVIYDAAGKTVRLFGVNYYAPFNHNYCNIAELGKDHCRAKEPPVSQLREDTLQFSFTLAPWKSITDLSGSTEYERTEEGSVRLAPGDYKIKL